MFIVETLSRLSSFTTTQISYEAFLEDGSQIDSTKNRALQFKVGHGEVMEGLDVAVQHMSVGQVCEVTIPSLYAYGTTGCPPQVPPRAVLIYKIELLRLTNNSRV